MAWGLLSFLSTGERSPSGAAFCRQLDDELCPLPILPSFAKSIQLGCTSFLEQKAGCSLCEERQQLNFGPPRRGSRGAFTAGLASWCGCCGAAGAGTGSVPSPTSADGLLPWLDCALNGRAWHETSHYSLAGIFTNSF